MASMTMASLTAPSTPEALSDAPMLKRRFTLPPKLSEPARSRNLGGRPNPETNEILYSHTAGKIVSFSPPLTSRPNARGERTVDREPIGTLPWGSHTETTLAAGLICLYRLPGIGTYLGSGEVCQTLFRKSQCWCVDGETKFVLRIRPDTFYRIELPNNSSEDKQKAEELKEVLAKVLLYELTPCPFKRGFTVDLPPPPESPPLKRPWRPKPRPTPLAEVTSPDLDGIEEDIGVASDIGSIENTDDEHSGHTSNDLLSPEPEAEPDEANSIALDILKTPTRPRALNGSRAITAPPQLTLKTTPPSNSTIDRSDMISKDKDIPDSASIASSIDSFHSFHSFHSPISPLPPSPPYSDPSYSPPRSDIDLSLTRPRTRQHRRELSDLTVKASDLEIEDNEETPRWLAPDNPSTPINMETPALTNDTASQGDDLWSEAITTSPRTALRQRPNRRRAHSPLPSPANLYTPRTRMSGHHLTSAILHKTCSLLLGPPIQLVALMLNIAARIANGTLRGPSFTEGNNLQDIPCTWQFDADDSARDAWEEDDYGISLGVVPPARTRKAPDIGGSWEID